MVSYGCIQEEGAGRLLEHHSGESQLNRVWSVREHIIKPQKAQNITILLCHDDHEKGLLYVGGDCYLVHTKPQQDVQNLLVELRASTDTVIEGWPVRVCRSVIHDTNLGGFLVVSNDGMMWQITYLVAKIPRRLLHSFDNVLLNLILDGRVVLL